MTTYTAPPPTGWVAAELDEFFNGVLAKANAVWTDDMNNYTPAYLQPYLVDFKASLSALPAPTVPTQAVVNHGQAVVVQNAAGATQAGSPAAANVTLGTLNFVKLTV